MEHYLRETFRTTFKKLAEEQKEKKDWRKPRLCPKNKKNEWEHKAPEWYNHVVFDNKIMITALHNLYHSMQEHDMVYHQVPDDSWNGKTYQKYYDSWVDLFAAIPKEENNGH